MEGPLEGPLEAPARRSEPNELDGGVQRPAEPGEFMHFDETISCLHLQEYFIFYYVFVAQKLAH